MKFRIHAIFLSLFFALALCFSFSIEASAHDYERSDGQKTYSHSDVEGVTAEDVENASAADKKEMTRKFLFHAATHLHLIQTDPDLQDSIPDISREIVIYGKEARNPGVFNNGDTYLVGITKRGATTNHGRYQDLYGSRYDLEKEPVKTLTGAGNIEDGLDQAVCVDYEYPAGRSRVACAINQPTPAGVVTTTAGFDHAEGDLMRPDCSAFTLEVTARMVEDETDLNKKRELLKSFVQGVKDKTLEVLETTGLEVFNDPEFPAQYKTFPPGPEFEDEVNARVFEKVLCFREPDFFHGSVYPFVMDPVLGISFLNVLDFDIHGLSVSLIDPNPIGDEPNVLVAFQKTVTTGNTGNVEEDLAEGNNGFVTYHWDDPRTEEDNVEGFLGLGVVPGTSIKESYLEVVDVTSGIGPNRILYVFGSGIYLDPGGMPPGDDMMAGDDGDGCSIATTGSTHQSALLNLFLIVSVLFSAVFLRKRS